MARLQDFQSVTPAGSDNLLIVQSQGQGLATLNAVGQKVASETSMPSLNTTSKNTVGAINELKALVDNLTPVRYRYRGQLINSDGGTIKGCGTADIILCNGIARIDFALMIETADTTSHTNWGINRDFFTSTVGVAIIPDYTGTFTYFKPDGTVDGDRQGYAGTFDIPSGARQFWKPSRVYKSGSSYLVGTWADYLFPVGSRMVGSCYGTYS